MRYHVRINNSELIQIDANSQYLRSAKFNREKVRQAVLSLNTNPVIRQAVAEANEILERHGVTAVCKLCWEGKLRKETGGIGCCQGCVLSGEGACMRKPVSCAVWLCGYTKRLFPAADRELFALQERIGYPISNPQHPKAFRYNGLVLESRMKP